MDQLNDLEASILFILENHKGRDEAISREELVHQICDLEEFEISDRSIRSTIKHLVTQHGFAIGSCHWGYFLCITSDEIDKVADYYEKYGLSSLFVKSRLKKIEMRDYLGQLSLRFAPWSSKPNSTGQGG